MTSVTAATASHRDKSDRDVRRGGERDGGRMGERRAEMVRGIHSADIGGEGEGSCRWRERNRRRRRRHERLDPDL